MINWITLIASIYHWNSRVDNDLMILSYKKINEYIIKTLEIVNCSK